MIYYSDAGLLVYESNRKNCGTKFKLLECEEFIQYVVDSFYEKEHSLDCICGRAQRNNKFSKSKMVCTITLYNYVDAGLLTISNIDLPLNVKHSTRIARVNRYKNNLGTSIDERPKRINDRSKFGHWEIDTVIGKKDKSDSVLLTITEPMTCKEITRKIHGKTDEPVQFAISRLIEEAGEHFSKVFKSITSDNGSEFADLATIESSTETKVYFAHPYRSGERGTIERHSRLIKRFIPKGRLIKEFSIKSISRVQNWYNTLLRRILNYQTPDKAFEDQLIKTLYN